MTNQRFKVNDRVVVVGTPADELRDQEAEVVRIVMGGWSLTPRWYRVRLNGGRELYFKGSQLAKAKEVSGA